MKQLALMKKRLSHRTLAWLCVAVLLASLFPFYWSLLIGSGDSSTIRDADKIVVMDQGRVVEMGNHEELLEKKGRYYDLYMTQFAGNQI